MKHEKQRKYSIFCIFGILAAILFCCIAPNAAQAEEGKVYLSDLAADITGKHTHEDKLGLDICSYDSLSSLNIKNTVYDKGIGFHGTDDEKAYVEFNLKGTSYKKFAAYVGIQGRTDDNLFLDWGSLNFIVKVDGNTVAESGERKHGQEPFLLVADVTGGSVLRLEFDTCGGMACDLGVWGDAYLTKGDIPLPTVSAKPAVTQNPEVLGRDPLYLSDMVWSSCYGYTDEKRDEPVFRDSDVKESEIWINDVYYDKGLGMHASSGEDAHVEINLEGLGYTTFVSHIGVPMVSFDNSMASMEFVVYTDGTEAYRSGIMRLGDEEQLIKLDITNIKSLKLVLLPGDDGISGDCGIWAMAALSKKSDVNEIFTTPEPTAAPVRSAAPSPAVTTGKASPKSSAAATPPKDSNSIVPIIIVAAVVVAAAGGAGFIIWKKKADKKPENHE